MEEEVKLLGISYNHIDALWETILPYLIKTLEYCDNKYSIKNIYNCLKNRDMQLWVAHGDEGILSFGITQIINYPTQKRLGLLFIGGKELMKWAHFCEPIKQWAKEQGCTSIECFGRPGWEPLAKKYGFEKIHTVYKINI